MEVSLDRAITVIQQAGHYKQKSDEIARITGGRFNVFSILGVESRETSTHSAFLTELLNPKGTHDQGDVFLSLFIKMLQARGIGFPSEFNTKTTTVIKESRIGLINDSYTEGGQIDILLKDGQRNAICIENKIYAVDQEKQLIRYHQHLHCDFKGGILIYLTLSGDSASSGSTEDDVRKLTLGADYHCISYREDILGWLEECRKASVEVPVVREAIGQYIQLIKKLTNQTMVTKDRDALVDWVLKSDNVDSVMEMQNLWLDVHFNLVTKLLENLRGRELQYGLKLNGDSKVNRDPNDSIDFRFQKLGWDYTVRVILYPTLFIGVYRGEKEEGNAALKVELDKKLRQLNLGKILDSWTNNPKSTWLWVTKVDAWKVSPKEIPTEGMEVIIETLYKLTKELGHIELTKTWQNS
jgi:hypothetical protein